MAETLVLPSLTTGRTVNRWLCAIVTPLMVISACGGLAIVGGNGMRVDVSVPWRHATEGEVPKEVVNWRKGTNHCGWESAVVLAVGWPIGKPAGTWEDIRHYVRDPDEVLPEGWVRSKYAAVDRLPDKARNSEYRAGNIALYWMPGDDGHIYLVQEGGAMERWPAATELIACE